MWNLAWVAHFHISGHPSMNLRVENDLLIEEDPQDLRALWSSLKNLIRKIAWTRMVEFVDDLLLPTHLHYWQSINWNQDYHLGHSCQPIYIIGYLHCFCQLICQRVSKRKPSANSTLQIVDLGIQYEKRCFWLFLSLCRTASTTHDHIGWATSMPFPSINPTNHCWSDTWFYYRLINAHF